MPEIHIEMNDLTSPNYCWNLPSKEVNNEHGNTVKFIYYQEDTKTLHKEHWGEWDIDIEPELKILYRTGEKVNSE